MVQNSVFNGDRLVSVLVQIILLGKISITKIFMEIGNAAKIIIAIPK